jgi:hypothetical protein
MTGVAFHTGSLLIHLSYKDFTCNACSLAEMATTASPGHVTSAILQQSAEQQQVVATLAV